MNTTANATTTTATPAVNTLVWLVDYSAAPVNEVRDERRDSDGRFLKVNCELETKVKAHSSANVALAAKYGEDVNCLFA